MNAGDAYELLLLVHVLSAGLDELPAAQMRNVKHRFLHGRLLQHVSSLTMWPTVRRIAFALRALCCTSRTRE